MAEATDHAGVLCMLQARCVYILDLCDPLQNDNNTGGTTSMWGRYINKAVFRGGFKTILPMPALC